MRYYYVTSKGGHKYHAVPGQVSDVPRAEAFRRVERTVCGRMLVPYNYFEKRPTYANVCRTCEREMS